MKSSLNHIYRTIWSEALNAWVAVSELTSAKGKRSGSSLLNAVLTASARNSASSNRKLRLKPIVFAIAYCFALNAAQANPIGAQVVNGTAAINQSGNTLNITNSPNAIINWQGFSINTGETTRFIQQAASSSVLNRVIGADPSQLLGTLTSNGRVFLINPAGILVGQGARIDVAGFVASTLNITNSDFLAGKLNFGLTPNAGTIQNSGTITTPEGGTVYLVAPQIENQGIITTPKGETILAAGNTVQLMDTGTPGVSVQVTGANNSATNLGKILADSGRIGMVAATLKNSGTVSASSMVSEGGRVFLRATNRVEAGGTITANGTSGGTIEVLGNQVGIMDGATVTANGAQGGGTILVGGDYQGKNPDVPNAQVTYVAPTANIHADATDTGDGGKVIVWADDTTRAYGNISARGGNNGGNGGFIETSGKQYLDVAGIKVSTAAPNGTTGNWLLDPTDITIVHGTATGGAAFTFPFPFTSIVFDNGGGLTATLNDFDINTNLAASTNITITTSSATTGPGGDITFDASGGPITISNSSAFAALFLRLNADHDIKFIGGSTTFQSPANTSTLDLILNPVGKVTTAAGSSVTLDGNLGLTRAFVALARTWENSGTLSLTNNAALHIEHNYGAGASTFHNMSGGIVNVAAAPPGWAIWSNGCCQDGILINDGTFNVTAGTSFEAAYSQSSTGTLNVANGQFLNLQNANTLSGAFNIGTGSTLALNEVHNGARTFSSATINDAGTLSFSAPGITFANTKLFYTGGTGDFTIPTGITYIGDAGYWASRNLTVSSAITTTGNVTLAADSAGACVAGAATCGTVNFTGSGHITAATTNIYYNPPGSNNAADVNGVGPSYVTPTDFSANVTGLLNAWMLVNDVNQLQGMNTNLAGTYALGADIVATATLDWNAGAGFVPVGDPNVPPYGFTGTFDGANHTIGGANHTISHLFIDLTANNTIGLFGNIGGSGVVENVGLVDGSVSGHFGVGMLAGYNRGTINNVYSTGTVNGDTDVGGLVGGNEGGGGNPGSITYSYSNANVNGTNATIGGSNIGGLAGRNYGYISDAYSTGMVTGDANSSNVGGLVGHNVGDGVHTINNAYSTGVVAGHVNVGGLVGLNDSIISDSHVSGGSATGSSNVGGLAGYNSGTISNSYVSGGTVTGVGLGAVGGLVGVNWSGDISDSYVSGVTVSSIGVAPNGSNPVGGLVGYNNFGTISNSYVSNGHVTGTWGVGGLVGNNSDSIISGSWVDNVIVLGSTDVGGLAGYNSGSIEGSHVSGGSVTGTVGSQYVGGLAGYNAGSTSTPASIVGGSISNSYVDSGSVRGNRYVGGLVGYNTGNIVSGSVINSSGNPANNSTVTAIGATSMDIGGLVGSNWGSITGSFVSNGMVSVSSADYVGGLVGSNRGSIDGSHVSGGSVSGNWYVGGLAGNNASCDCSYSGAGSISNSYVDSGSVSGNRYVGGLVGYNSGNIVSGSVINSSGNPANNSTVTAIGAASMDIGGLVGYNTGSINGSFVSNGMVSASSAGNVGGLAGYNSGSIDGSYVSGGNVTGSSNVGGLVGFNNSNINNSYVNGGSVIATVGDGSGNAGGLVGYNSGSISNSYASNGSVSGSISAIVWYMGGLVGNNNGIIINTYVSNGSVSGNTTVGGLVGYNSGGSISNSYASNGSLSGGTVGGLVGYNSGTGSISDSFWDTQTTGNAVGLDSGLSINVLGLDTAGMMTMSNFTNWDIANTGGAGAVWRIYENNTAPLLTSFLTQVTVTAHDDGKTYNGQAYSGGNGVTYSDVNAVLSGTVAYGGTSQGAVTAGSYIIAPSGLYSNQQGYDISYANGALTISQLAVNIAILTGNKVYDGTTTFSMGQLGISNIVSGDVVSLSAGAANTADKNVGVSKPFVSFSGLALAGASAGNYTLTGVSGNGTITVRPLSTWNGLGGNALWSNSANWDALPDGNNVLAVAIPTGSNVTYDGAVTKTVLQTFTSAGNMALNGNNLSIGSYIQTGGSLTGTGNLNVTSNFMQTGGTITLTGAAIANISQIIGNLNIANLSAPVANLTASTGAITQTGSIIVAALTTHSATGTTLTNIGNQIGSFSASNSGSGNIALTNSGVLTIADINNNGGDILVDNTGATTTTGLVSASGAVSINAHSPLTIGSSGIAAGGNITLTAGATAGAGDNLTLNGLIKSTGSTASIILFAGDNLAQNANVSSNGGSITATAVTGGISMALGTSTSGGSIGYSAPAGNIILATLDAGNGVITLGAGGNVSVVPGSVGPSLIGGTAVINVGGNANFKTQVQKLDVTVGGSFTIADTSGNVFSDVVIAPVTIVSEVVQQLVTTVITTTNKTGITTTSDQLSDLSIAANIAPLPGADITGANSIGMFKSLGGGNIGGAIGTFGGEDKAGSGDNGDAGHGTAKSDDDAKKNAAKKEGDAKKDEENGKDDKDKGKLNAKPEKC